MKTVICLALLLVAIILVQTSRAYDLYNFDIANRARERWLAQLDPFYHPRGSRSLTRRSSSHKTNKEKESSDDDKKTTKNEEDGKDGKDDEDAGKHRRHGSLHHNPFARSWPALPLWPEPHLPHHTSRRRSKSKNDDRKKTTSTTTTTTTSTTTTEKPAPPMPPPLDSFLPESDYPPSLPQDYPPPPPRRYLRQYELPQKYYQGPSQSQRFIPQYELPQKYSPSPPTYYRTIPTRYQQDYSDQYAPGVTGAFTQGSYHRYQGHPAYQQAARSPSTQQLGSPQLYQQNSPPLPSPSQRGLAPTLSRQQALAQSLEQAPGAAAASPSLTTVAARSGLDDASFSSSSPSSSASSASSAASPSGKSPLRQSSTTVSSSDVTVHSIGNVSSSVADYVADSVAAAVASAIAAAHAQPAAVTAAQAAASADATVVASGGSGRKNARPG